MPRSEMVAAAIRTIFAQPGPVHVAEQLDTIATMLGRQFPKVESMLRDELGHMLDNVERPRWYVRRCLRCNPGCASIPAWSYGREYSRRRKARARRSRR